MNATLLGRQFQMNHWATHANLQEMSHEDSLVHPAPGGNCFNWVLGHIVSTRNAVLAALGEAPIWTGTKDLPYRRGSRAPLAAVEAHPLETLVDAYDASQASVERALDRLTDADLSRPHDDRQTLGEWLAGLSFHEAYHVGQLGLLRRIVGKSGAIA